MPQDKTVISTSNATGKMVKIRHATEYDILLVRNMLNKFRLDGATPDYHDTVVAYEDDRLLGFVSKKSLGHGIMNLSVVMGEDEIFMSDLMVHHLLEKTA